MRGGGPGAGKTTLAHQVVFANATPERPALYFTVLGEPTIKMLRYQRQSGFFDPALAGSAVQFVNVSDEVLDGNLNRVLDKIVNEVEKLRPGFVVVDSFRTIGGRAGSVETQGDLSIEQFVQRLSLNLTTWEVTSFLLGEYGEEEQRNPVFTVADGVFWLSQATDRNSVVRKIQVVKARGTAPMPGLHTFRITQDGVQIFPRIPEQNRARMQQRRDRLSTGIPGLDEMTGGGVVAGDAVMLTGPAGSGKSTIATQFMVAGLRNGETGVIAVFEEYPEEYLARADARDSEIGRMIKAGKLEVIYLRPLDLSVDEALYEILAAVGRLDAKRVVIDSLSGFEVALAPTFREDFRESLYRLVGALTATGVTVFMAAEVVEGFTDVKFTAEKVSFITDEIIIQRYVEIEGELKRVMAVIKMRGSEHSHMLRLYELTGAGVRVGGALTEYDGIILGVEFREASQSDNELDMQRQVAEQILLGALRERGLADDAEAARRRAAFLAEAGRLLAKSVDRAGTLVALSKLALPTLGSWCVVDLLGANGAIQRLGIFHPDPLKQVMAARLEATWTPRKTDGFGVAAMLRDLRTITVTTEIDSVLGAGPHGDENRRLLQEIGAGAMLSVPLVARGKLLGAITFISAGTMHAYSGEEIQLAEDLAQRGSLALENAQLYETAIVLQKTAESANRAKTTFLGAMSHELRTPLNAIGGYVDLIDMGLRGPVTKLQHTDLARIKTNQQHLLVLINEIINYARLGGGHVTYNVVEFSVIEHIGRAVELVEPLIARNGLSYERIHTGPALVARADPEKVTQILVNLLSNAIKFTPEGGQISIKTGVSGGFVSIGVRDTGVGIPAEKVEEVFEPFVQLEDSLAGRESGVGLGLAISRDLARAMSGDLTVASVEGQGSCFTLALQGYPE